MLSSAAEEYNEASEACQEIAFVRGILSEFYGQDETYPLVPTPLMIDNQAAIAMGPMPQFTEKQKHIPIRMCHLKECCADGLVHLYPVSTRSAILSTDPNLELTHNRPSKAGCVIAHVTSTDASRGSVRISDSRPGITYTCIVRMLVCRMLAISFLLRVKEKGYGKHAAN
jgi:hypothetical protein